MIRSFARRSFVKKLAGAAGLTILNPAIGLSKNTLAADSFSFIHLTDMHVRRKRQGHVGYQACIADVNKNYGSADFVLMGGDLAFDGNYTAKEEFIDQIDLYKTVSDELKMPYYNSIGNHDVLGWSSRRKVAVDDPDLGKKLIMDKLKMVSSYYSFNHKGWHFVVLDSIHPIEADHGISYKARLGEAQLEWLRYDLGKNAGMPTVVMTHIAAFCHLGQMNGDPKFNPFGHMVIEDTVAFRTIIERHNVKAVLQGHSHVPEDFFYNGIWYITSQSVSAAWWGGNWKGFMPGYSVFTTDGDKLRWQRKNYDWQHHLEPEDTLERQRIAEREAFEKQQADLREQEVKAAHK
jgi:3',5'-cyclic-AMP phosphodiesterase